MTLAAYTGHEPLTFPDYLDLDTGKTLHADPRPEPYDIAPASGRLVPDVPEAWFTPVPPPAPAKGSAKTATETGPAGEQEPGGDPETGTHQQF